MEFAGMNYLAILVAAGVAFMFGGVWYGVLAKQWMAAAGIDDEMMAASKKGGATTRLMITAFLSSLVMAWVLAGLIGHLGQGQVWVRGIDTGGELSPTFEFHLDA